MDTTYFRWIEMLKFDKGRKLDRQDREGWWWILLLIINSSSCSHSPLEWKKIIVIHFTNYIFMGKFYEYLRLSWNLKGSRYISAICKCLLVLKGLCNVHEYLIAFNPYIFQGHFLGDWRQHQSRLLFQFDKLY